MQSDPFETLGLPRRYSIDVSTLETRYRELQRAYHPDRFVRATPAERQLSLAKAVAINDAYRTLRDDLSRAEAFLRGVGQEPPRPSEVPEDPAFLMEVMELRESLLEAKERRDLTRIAVVARSAKAEYDALQRELCEVLSEPNDFQRGRAVLSRLRYYRRLQDEIERLEDELTSGDHRPASVG